MYFVITTNDSTREEATLEFANRVDADRAYDDAYEAAYEYTTYDEPHEVIIVQLASSHGFIRQATLGEYSCQECERSYGPGYDGICCH